MDYKGPERRADTLTDEQINVIAERAAEKAIAKVYEQIGRSVVKKALFVIGAAVVAVLAWLAGTGQLK